MPIIAPIPVMTPDTKSYPKTQDKNHAHRLTTMLMQHHGDRVARYRYGCQPAREGQGTHVCRTAHDSPGRPLPGGYQRIHTGMAAAPSVQAYPVFCTGFSGNPVSGGTIVH